MKDHEIELVLDGTALIEYCSNWYEYIGEDEATGKHIFSDINDGYPIYVSDKALRQSTEFFFTLRP